MKVRWGLVFVMVLIGVVGLWRAIGWYFDPVTEAKRNGAGIVIPPPARPAATVPAPRPLPQATPHEIALLESSDPNNRIIGADTLASRAVTPEVIRAVDDALARHPEPEDFERRLVCLKSRFEGSETLEFLLARFPTGERAREWNPKPDAVCMLNALAARATEAPDRVLAVLLPAAYSSNGSTRERVLQAFHTLDVREIPPVLLVEASTAGSPHQYDAFRAALALGAIRLNPALVAHGVRGQQTQDSSRWELQNSPHPNAARIVADVWAEQPSSRVYTLLAEDREKEHHDVSAGLLEIVLDVTQPDVKRLAAAQELSMIGEVGPLRDLRALVPTLAEGPLKASVEETVRALEDRVKNGDPERMHVLPPRTLSRREDVGREPIEQFAARTPAAIAQLLEAAGAVQA
jgi:hypothetical protein